MNAIQWLIAFVQQLFGINATGKTYGVGTIAIIAVAMLAVAFFAMGGKIPTFAVPGQPPTPPKLEVVCSSTTSPELKLVPLDIINEGTSRLADIDANVLVNGSYNAGYHLADDSTADASAGDGYAVWFKDSSGNTTYFGDSLTGNVPCAEMTTITAKIATVGALTLSAYNTDDGLINSTSDAQSIAASEGVSIPFRLKETTNDACLGSAQSNKDLGLCVDFNGDLFSAPEIKLNGAKLPTMEVPAGHSSIRSSKNADNTQCVVITGVKSICDYTILSGFTLDLATKTAEVYADSGDLNMWVYMPQVFQQADTGLFDWYYSDAYNATQIITPKTGAIYVS